MLGIYKTVKAEPLLIIFRLIISSILKLYCRNESGIESNKIKFILGVLILPQFCNEFLNKHVHNNIALKESILFTLINIKLNNIACFVHCIFKTRFTKTRLSSFPYPQKRRRTEKEIKKNVCIQYVNLILWANVFVDICEQSLYRFLIKFFPNIG